MAVESLPIAEKQKYIKRSQQSSIPYGEHETPFIHYVRALLVAGTFMFGCALATMASRIQGKELDQQPIIELLDSDHYPQILRYIAHELTPDGNYRATNSQVSLYHNDRFLGLGTYYFLEMHDNRIMGDRKGAIVSQTPFDYSLLLPLITAFFFLEIIHCLRLINSRSS